MEGDITPEIQKYMHESDKQHIANQSIEFNIVARWLRDYFEIKR